MNTSDVPTSRNDAARTIRLGAIVWMLAIQFFIVQIIVQSAWATPFSLTTNYISDLGNTACGPYPADSTNTSAHHGTRG
jgi:hypothetical protein